MTDHDRSSSARSSPGRTTAPLGRREITASSSAVAGIEPVDPAAITGPTAGARASRAASMRISALRCAAGLERPRSRSASGQCDVTISRKSSVTCHQPARLPDASSPSFFQSASSVSISSISAARSRASQMASAAEAGTVTSSSNSAATCAGKRLFQACTSGASASNRSSGAIGCGELDLACHPPRRPASSSSNSPSGRIAGRIAERPPSRSANTLRSSRAARRVGTKMVVSASVSGAPSQANSGTSVPVSTASASVGRKGASAGIDRTRGKRSAVTILAVLLRRRPVRRAGWRRACRP